MRHVQLFFEVTWPCFVTLLWFLLFEGATFFVGKKNARIARSLSLIGGLLCMIYAIFHFYRATVR